MLIERAIATQRHRMKSGSQSGSGNGGGGGLNAGEVVLKAEQDAITGRQEILETLALLKDEMSAQMDELQSARSFEQVAGAPGQPQQYEVEDSNEIFSRDEGYGRLADKQPAGPVFMREGAPSPTGAHSPNPSSLAGSGSSAKGALALIDQPSVGPGASGVSSA